MSILLTPSPSPSPSRPSSPSPSPAPSLASSRYQSNVSFAPLPDIAPRKRKSKTPLGVAGRSQILRNRSTNYQSRPEPPPLPEPPVPDSNGSGGSSNPSSSFNWSFWSRKRQTSAPAVVQGTSQTSEGHEEPAKDITTLSGEDAEARDSSSESLVNEEGGVWEEEAGSVQRPHPHAINVPTTQTFDNDVPGSATSEKTIRRRSQTPSAS